jgi:uncharacterized membrane protein YgdD (TMEM256/DUF423 family)
MHKKFIATGVLLGAIAVALGAFGAHGLKKIVPAETVQSFQTGVQYQMYHALVLILSGILFEKFPNRYLLFAGRFFLAGIIFFSGSLYLMAMFKAIALTGFDKIGIITPIGGVFFITGWLLLFTGIAGKGKS